MLQYFSASLFANFSYLNTAAVHECACCFGLLVPSLSRNSAAAWPGSGIFPLPWPPLLPSSPSCSSRSPAARCPPQILPLGSPLPHHSWPLPFGALRPSVQPLLESRPWPWPLLVGMGTPPEAERSSPGHYYCFVVYQIIKIILTPKNETDRYA